MPDASGKIRGITVPSVPWHELSDVETGVRDADQMLWDKQTDEGPSALEKLRDK